MNWPYNALMQRLIIHCRLHNNETSSINWLICSNSINLKEPIIIIDRINGDSQVFINIFLFGSNPNSIQRLQNSI